MKIETLMLDCLPADRSDDSNQSSVPLGSESANASA